MPMLTSLTHKIARSPGDPKVISTGRSSLLPEDRVAKGLGWFSLALGAVELVAANRLARWLGLPHQAGLIRAFGAREIGAGVLTLSSEKGPGLWSRVAGDALDIAVLAGGLDRRNRRRGNAEMAMAAVIGVTILDIVTAARIGQRHGRTSKDVRSYRDRSGYPKGIAASRGAARDLEVKDDMRALPRAMRA
jgi:hypothetical protein